MERIFRRQFLEILVGGAAAFALACSQEKKKISPIPTEEAPTPESRSFAEVNIPISKPVTIVDAQRWLIPQIGISRVAFLPRHQESFVFVFAQLGEGVIAQETKIENPDLTPKDGFCEFDERFDVNTARLLPSDNGKRADYQKTVSELTPILRSNRLFEGLLTYYALPPLNKDLMFYFKENILTDRSGKSSPKAILRAKLKFIESPSQI